MDQYHNLIEHIEGDYATQGHRSLSAARLCGKTRKGKDTWHHIVFRPLEQGEIDGLRMRGR